MNARCKMDNSFQQLAQIGQLQCGIVVDGTYQRRAHVMANAIAFVPANASAAHTT